MERRSLLQLACAIMPISLLTTRAEAATPDQAKVVYHLSDLDKVDFVMGNIRNHYNGMGGPDKVTIALSCTARRSRRFTRQAPRPT